MTSFLPPGIDLVLIAGDEQRGVETDQRAGILIPPPPLMGMLRLAAVMLATVLGSPAVMGADLFEGFAPGWREHWQEKSLFTRPTIYRAVTDGDRLVLHASSQQAHAGLLRQIDIPAPESARLRWSWKVRQALDAAADERSRAGDDFTARVFVVFETSFIPLRTRAINYVWASREPVGAIFPSPYTANVAMFVVRSGNVDAGRWCDESRDVLADYRKFFGRSPEKISAVAVLVDTDNTGREAEAWFAGLSLETVPAAPAAPAR